MGRERWEDGEGEGGRMGRWKGEEEVHCFVWQLVVAVEEIT